MPKNKGELSQQAHSRSRLRKHIFRDNPFFLYCLERTNPLLLSHAFHCRYWNSCITMPAFCFQCARAFGTPHGSYFPVTIYLPLPAGHAEHGAAPSGVFDWTAEWSARGLGWQTLRDIKKDIPKHCLPAC